MLNPSNRPPRPRLTARILMYGLLDMFGLACVAIGASWFAGSKSLLMSNFPTSTAEAVACTASGATVMFWAVTRILREIARQGPDMQARYEAYVAANHPDKALPTEDRKPD